MAIASTSSSLTDRMLRAAKLDIHLYEEVEADTNATNQALLVVVLVAVATGIGAAIAGAAQGNLVMALIGGVLRALIGWAAWSFVMYFVGTRIFGGTATYGELLRTLGFAYTPGVLSILLFIPFLGGLISLAAGIWTLVASFIGIRQALDIDNGKTIGTIVIGIIAFIIVSIIIGIIFGAGAVLGGAMM
jgi:hypothetical protein